MKPKTCVALGILWIWVVPQIAPHVTFGHEVLPPSQAPVLFADACNAWALLGWIVIASCWAINTLLRELLGGKEDAE
jgi:hypothetical protein